MPKVHPLKIEPLDAEILLAFVLQRPREYIIAHPELTLSWRQKIYLKYLLKKRQRGMPIAYLLGHKEFFGLNFLVNKHTLIPRPETELLVESVLELIKKKPGTINLIDVGTGSGCIIISILKNSTPQIMATAIDISPKALQVARQNATRHNVKITFLAGNLLQTLPPQNNPTIITANLPYLTAEQFAAEPSIQHEPQLALVADNAGLGLYEKLLKQIKNKFYPPEFPIFIFLEINPEQTTKISLLIQKYFPTAKIEIKSDLAGQDRLVIIALEK